VKSLGTTRRSAKGGEETQRSSARKALWSSAMVNLGTACWRPSVRLWRNHFENPQAVVAIHDHDLFAGD